MERETKPTISVRINVKDLNKLEALAKRNSLTRSTVINLAIKKYIEESALEESKLDRVNEKVERIEKHLDFVNKDVRRTSSRVNILSRQVDSSQKRLNDIEKR